MLLQQLQDVLARGVHLAAGVGGIVRQKLQKQRPHAVPVGLLVLQQLHQIIGTLTDAHQRFGQQHQGGPLPLVVGQRGIGVERPVHGSTFHLSTQQGRIGEDVYHLGFQPLDLGTMHCLQHHVQVRGGDVTHKTITLLHLHGKGVGRIDLIAHQRQLPAHALLRIFLIIRLHIAVCQPHNVHPESFHKRLNEVDTSAKVVVFFELSFVST